MNYETFKNCAAQGDMLMRRIDKLPDGVKLDNGTDGDFVLAHSETGHSHVVRKQDGVQFFANDNNPMIAYLVVNNPKEECFVEHKRKFDTHKPFQFNNGIYEIRRQIESTPEGFRRALD